MEDNNHLFLDVLAFGLYTGLFVSPRGSVRATALQD